MSEKKVEYCAIYQREKEIRADGHISCPMLTEAQGCVNQCAAGISSYYCEKYSLPAQHEFQEGFYVIEGTGQVKIGQDEFPVEKGYSFLVPVYMEHGMKKSAKCDVLKVFWFHSSI